MRDDELQILGKPRKGEQRRRWFAVLLGAIVIGVACLALGVWLGYKGKTADVNMERNTILPELQTAVDSMLNQQMEAIGALHGQVVLMEVETGNVVAMVGREQRFDGKYQPCENFAYQQEPGSLMKVATALALLEPGKVKMTDMVDTGDGVWNVDGDVLKDHNWKRGGYGIISLEKALGVSSNIAIGKLVDKAFRGKEMQYFNLLDKMSLGKPDSIQGINGLKPMMCHTPKDSLWASYMLLWGSIGYERKIAPIQTLTFYNAIANDGKMVKPTLQKGQIEIINPQIARKENITQMQIALERVVSKGLGKKAGVPFFSVAGKTGTAEVNRIGNEESGFVSEYHLEFCGYFPADKPRYSMIVSMNKLDLPASGGGMAGTLFHNIVEWMVMHSMLPKR